MFFGSAGQLNVIVCPFGYTPPTGPFIGVTGSHMPFGGFGGLTQGIGVVVVGGGGGAVVDAAV